MPESQLDTASDRFLSLCYQFALNESWLTPEHLNKDFNAETLMTALEPASELRARLLVEAAGVHAKIAPKKSTAAAAEDLQIALDEKICTPANLLEVVSIDEHVRYLDTQKLWELLIREQFWLESGKRSQQRLLAMIETALQEELLNLPQLIRAVSPERLASDLPAATVQATLVAAIEAGLESKPFNATLLLESIGLSNWLEHISLSHIWDAVILGEVARAAGFEGAKSAPSSVKQASKAQAAAKTKKKAAAAKAIAQPKQAAAASAAAGAAGAPASMNAAESEARQRATSLLSSIQRLPASAQSLSSPELLGLESMYSELLLLDGPEEQEEHIQDSFPNQKILASALSALLNTLDPNQLAAASKAGQPNSNTLIKLLIAYEARAAQAKTAPTSNAPASAPKKSMVPPPPKTTASPRPSLAPPPPLSQRRAGR
ncbi:MAG: hypothetical protein MK135_00330 [Polyangiaceae bacterium]|nr:hypothetical protein [Polyangiaceae bacterium]